MSSEEGSERGSNESLAAASFDRRALPPAAVESQWRARDGHPIRRLDWPIPALATRGSLLFLPGRADYYEKYFETLHGWAGQGWAVGTMDWRGQGGSGRLGNDAVTGHVADFSVWVDDLAAAWQDFRASRPHPHVIVAHSMGGHIALRALAEGRVDPAALVLIAPMLGLLPQWLPSSVLHFAARLMIRLDDPHRPAWKWSEKPGALPADRSVLLTHDRERYADEEWWRSERPELVMGPGSWGWVERAMASIRVLERPGVLERVRTPVFVVATSADRLVSFRAIERAVARLPEAGMLVFGKEARHEILREEDSVRDHALAAIDGFLARAAPPQPGPR